MKKIFYSLLTTLFFLTIINIITHAAPARWGIAINDDAKQCAGFWAGDEFVGYTLPEGWNDFYYETGTDNMWMIFTDYGTCNFQEGEETCCLALGLEYVGENIGEGSDLIIPDNNNSNSSDIILIISFVCSFILIILLLLVIIIIKKRRK